MLIFPWKCKKDTDSVDSKVFNTKNGRPMLSWRCAVWSSKRSRFMKEQEEKHHLIIKTPFRT